MSLRGNWRIYQDPTFPKFPIRVVPAGDRVKFRVKDIDTLRWLVGQTATATSIFTPARRWLVGLGCGGEECAQLDETQFSVVNGLGRIEAVDRAKLCELPRLPGYESFLLNLTWKSAFGWPSEMHVLALASGKEKDIEWVYDAQC